MDAKSNRDIDNLLSAVSRRLEKVSRKFFV